MVTTLQLLLLRNYFSTYILHDPHLTLAISGFPPSSTSKKDYGIVEEINANLKEKSFDTIAFNAEIVVIGGNYVSDDLRDLFYEFSGEREFVIELECECEGEKGDDESIGYDGAGNCDVSGLNEGIGDQYGECFLGC
ncbi:MAG: hypothetical protein EZS28_007607 [Streblomastix strix]|uniref:Uncharacterized protein n=1 Tax=Streblomastix strix TaxID=222440 RepID=A0A5J4WS03_9EUKA|nr:MAG: hypothetical protein EZS28_007607 [Streblomastix strix]